jgi:hypothetical protein
MADKFGVHGRNHHLGLNNYAHEKIAVNAAINLPLAAKEYTC